MLELCVIGDPVAHSLSPAIHTALLAQRGLKGRYQAVTVRPEVPFRVLSYLASRPTPPMLSPLT